MTKEKKQRAYRAGLRAEFLTAWMFRLRGYRIRRKRYKTPAGEIDLIAENFREIVFIEVKARTGTDEALFSVTARMKERIRRAAEYYIADHPACAGKDMRFDVVAMVPPLGLKHIKNAW